MQPIAFSFLSLGSFLLVQSVEAPPPVADQTETGTSTAAKNFRAGACALDITPKQFPVVVSRSCQWWFLEKYCK